MRSDTRTMRRWTVAWVCSLTRQRRVGNRARTGTGRRDVVGCAGTDTRRGDGAPTALCSSLIVPGQNQLFCPILPPRHGPCGRVLPLGQPSQQVTMLDNSFIGPVFCSRQHMAPSWVQTIIPYLMPEQSACPDRQECRPTLHLTQGLTAIFLVSVSAPHPQNAATFIPIGLIEQHGLKAVAMVERPQACEALGGGYVDVREMAANLIDAELVRPHQ